MQQPEVLNVVNQNKLVMEPFLDFVDAALANVYHNVQEIGMEHFWSKRMMKLKSKLELLILLLGDMSQIQSTRPVLIQDEELNSK